jgi:hypothetical protein
MTDENGSSLQPDDDDFIKTRGTPKPGEATRANCLVCCNGSAHEVRYCSSKHCPLWLFRLGTNPTADMLAEASHLRMYPLESETTVGDFHENGGTRVKAIKRYCLDCSGNSRADVRKCQRVACELYPFRLGKNPNRKMGPEQRAIAAARLGTNVRRGKNGNIG